ncbi:hypothetical protein ABEF93_002530 [Exophiala dermatitidis]
MSDNSDEIREQRSRLIAIVSRINTFPDNVKEVFTDEVCDLILWLALHGLQAREMAWVVKLKVPRPVGDKASERITEAQHVLNLERTINHYIKDLLFQGDGDEGEGDGESGDADTTMDVEQRDADKEADDLVSRLIGRDEALNWSPYYLEKAIDYIATETGGIDPIVQSRKLAEEGLALARWRARHPGQDPRPGMRYDKDYQAARRAWGREEPRRQALEATGYREDGSRAAERVLMKRWLLKMRQEGGFCGRNL